MYVPMRPLIYKLFNIVFHSQTILHESRFNLLVHAAPSTLSCLQSSIINLPSFSLQTYSLFTSVLYNNKQLKQQTQPPMFWWTKHGLFLPRGFVGTNNCPDGTASKMGSWSFCPNNLISHREKLNYDTCHIISTASRPVHAPSITRYGSRLTLSALRFSGAVVCVV